MLRQLFPPILQTQEAELICEVCLLLTHPLFRDMPRCLQAILSPPSFDNVPSHLWHQRQLGPHVLSSQSESMHCAQHSPSWNKICFIDTARFKEHNSQTGDSAGLPSVGRLCKDLSKRGGNLPEPPNTKDVCERGSDKNPADTDVLMLRKILPVSSLSLFKISLFPHRHPVCGVSVPGAKHSSCRAWSRWAVLLQRWSQRDSRKEQLRSHILPAELRTPLKSCSLASSFAWPRETWEDEHFRPQMRFAAGRLFVRAGCAPTFELIIAGMHYRMHYSKRLFPLNACLSCTTKLQGDQLRQRDSKPAATNSFKCWGACHACRALFGRGSPSKKWWWWLTLVELFLDFLGHISIHYKITSGWSLSTDRDGCTSSVS